MIKNCIAMRFTEAAHWQMIESGALSQLANENPSVEPHPTQWRRFGFAHLDQFGVEPVFVGTNKTAAFCIRLQERLLPGAVINAKLSAKCKEFYERESRHPHRKEVAQLKDDLIAELLPAALVKPKNVLCIVAWPYLFIDTGSFKMQEEIVSWLRERLNVKATNAAENLEYWPAAWGHLPLTLLPSLPAPSWLRKIAVTPFTFDVPEGEPVPDDYRYFRHASSAVLKSKISGTIRMKDVDFSDEEIDMALDSGRSLVELGVEWGEQAGQTDLACRVTDHLAVKGLKFAIAVHDRINDDQAAVPDEERNDVSQFDASLAITASTLRTFFDELLKDMRKTVPDDDTEIVDAMQKLYEIEQNFIQLQELNQFRISVIEDTNDPLLKEAEKLCYEHEAVGISKLQRCLRIGYHRASVLIEKLAESNFVSGENHAGVRKSLVYVSDDI